MPSQELAQKLLEMQRKVSAAQQEVARIEGRHDATMERLSKEFGVSDIAAARKKLKVLVAELDKRDAVFEKNVDRVGQELDALLGVKV